MESDKQKMDLQSYQLKLSSKLMQDGQYASVRDIKRSQLSAQEISRIITSISRCELELDILVDQADQAGSAGSLYPRRCLQCLKLFREILEIEREIKNDIKHF